MEKYKRLVIRPSNLCNLKCKYCIAESAQGTKISPIPLEFAFDLLQSYRFDEISFQGHRETSLSPNIKDLIREVAPLVKKIFIITNASGRDIAWWEDLIRSIPKHVILHIMTSFHFEANNYIQCIELSKLTVHLRCNEGYNVTCIHKGVLSESSVERIKKLYYRDYNRFTWVWDNLELQVDHLVSDEKKKELLERVKDLKLFAGQTGGDILGHNEEEGNGATFCEYDLSTLDLRIWRDDKWYLYENLTDFKQFQLVDFNEEDEVFGYLQSLKRAPCMERIPKILHRIHVGTSPSPFAKQCQETQNFYFKDWKIQTSVAKITENNYLQEMHSLGQFSTIKTYKLLKCMQEQGGVFLGDKVEVFKPFNTLIFNQMFVGAVYTNYGDVELQDTVFGAIPHHRVVNRALEIVEKEYMPYNKPLKLKTILLEVFADLGVTIHHKGNIKCDIEHIREGDVTLYFPKFFNTNKHREFAKHSDNHFCASHYDSTLLKEVPSDT